MNNIVGIFYLIERKKSYGSARPVYADLIKNQGMRESKGKRRHTYEEFD